jgi:hypothetical protein
MSGTVFRPMMRFQVALLVLMVLLFSSQGVAHDHVSTDLERDAACLVCSYTDAGPLAASVSPLPLGAGSTNEAAWPSALDMVPRDCSKGYLSRGPPVSL